MENSDAVRRTIEAVLAILAEQGAGDDLGYASSDGKYLLERCGVLVEQFRDAMSLAKEAGLIDFENVMGVPENRHTGIVHVRLTPKGREKLYRDNHAVASPLADARTLLTLLRGSAGEKPPRYLDSRELCAQLSWGFDRALEAADTLVGQGIAKFARRTMGGFFSLELTPRGRL